MVPLTKGEEEGVGTQMGFLFPSCSAEVLVTPPLPPLDIAQNIITPPSPLVGNAMVKTKNMDGFQMLQIAFWSWAKLLRIFFRNNIDELTVVRKTEGTMKLINSFAS